AAGVAGWCPGPPGAVGGVAPAPAAAAPDRVSADAALVRLRAARGAPCPHALVAHWAAIDACRPADRCGRGSVVESAARHDDAGRADHAAARRYLGCRRDLGASLADRRRSYR